MTVYSTNSSEIMTATRSRSVMSRRLTAGAAALALCSLASCKTADILQVNNVDILPPGGLLTPNGVGVLTSGSIQLFYNAYAGATDSYAVITGNMADELYATDTFDDRNLPNRRAMNDNLPSMLTPYLALHAARTNATIAITTIQKQSPTTPKFTVGELYAFRAFTEDFFGELYCAGVPFSKDDGVTRTFGVPLTTAQMFTAASASFDSALALSDTSTAVRYLAQVGKGRALLNLGQYAAAAAAVAGVPTSFQRQAYYSLTTSNNGLWLAAGQDASRYNVSKNEGTNGLDFLPCAPTGCPPPATSSTSTVVKYDPRLPWQTSTRSGFNAAFSSQPTELKYGRTSPVTIADGIEARLIEAEARLQGGTQADRDAVFSMLNNLRANAIVPAVPLLPGTTGPTTQAAAVTQLFNERAYWLFLTGHRLGDLRRLIRQYGRDAETVFPTGPLDAPGVGTYGTDVNFVIPSQEKNNPNFTGCLDRKA
jgi:hypothetical protein